MSETFKVGHCEVTIEQDTTPFSPREDDNVGTMVCWHRRYDLGDEQPKDSPDEYLQQLARRTAPDDDARYLDRACDLLWDTRYSLHESRVARILAKKREEVIERNLIILPLYLYDHGGITMSTGAFSCPWDSGTVGFIYCSLEKAQYEWGTEDSKLRGWDGNANYTRKEDGSTRTLREAATRFLESEVEEYDQYLTGDVWGYVVSTPDGDEESCWGFFGHEYCEEQARSIAEHMSERYEKEQARLEMEEAVLEQQTTLAICWP
jgi:hypothetical protein